MGKHKRNFETENFKFVQNGDCEYFPCHKGVDEGKFNCLFCFCPLYMLKNQCGGNFKVSKGVKDCSNCTIPHSPGGYEYVMNKMKEVIKIGSDF
jgi:Zn-finger protein